MTKTLYVASSNAGKLRDFSAAAEIWRLDAAAVGTALACNFLLLPLPGLAELKAPAEDEETFAGNARTKAAYYSLHANGALVIADDSGLEVDALDGAPGVYSARYAERAGAVQGGPNRSLDAANNTHLIEELTRVLTPAGRLASLDQRSARYRCVLVAARDGICLGAAEGSVEGHILLQPRGENGFGYDPLFYLPALGQTMAELDQATRLSLSHRGGALRALLPELARLLPG